VLFRKRSQSALELETNRGKGGLDESAAQQWPSRRDEGSSEIIRCRHFGQNYALLSSFPKVWLCNRIFVEYLSTLERPAEYIGPAKTATAIVVRPFNICLKDQSRKSR